MHIYIYIHINIYIYIHIYIYDHMHVAFGWRQLDLDLGFACYWVCTRQASGSTTSAMGQILFNFLKQVGIPSHCCADSGALACCATLPMFSALGLAYAFLPEPLGEHEVKPIGSGLPSGSSHKKKGLPIGSWSMAVRTRHINLLLDMLQL